MRSLIEAEKTCESAWYLDGPSLKNPCYCMLLYVIYIAYLSGWWFGTWLDFIFHHILGMSSSQLTKSIIFQRGRSTTNHPPVGCASPPRHRRGPNVVSDGE